jgi:hypothetical protein
MGHWIAGAITHPGALTRKAKAAGQSTMAFARAHAHTPGATGAQSRLAERLAAFRKTGKFKKARHS